MPPLCCLSTRKTLWPGSLLSLDSCGSSSNGRTPSPWVQLPDPGSVELKSRRPWLPGGLAPGCFHPLLTCSLVLPAAQGPGIEKSKVPGALLYTEAGSAGLGSVQVESSSCQVCGAWLGLGHLLESAHSLDFFSESTWLWIFTRTPNIRKITPHLQKISRHL